MIVIYPSGVRVIPEDRNPTFPHKEHNAGVSAPHVLTVRWSYTVPANRRAKLHGIWSYVERTDTDLATANTGILVTVQQGTFSGQVTYNMLFDNTIGAHQGLFVPVGMVLETGAQVFSYTFADGDGGSCVYSSTGIITEYDK